MLVAMTVSLARVHVGASNNQGPNLDPQTGPSNFRETPLIETRLVALKSFHMAAKKLSPIAAPVDETDILKWGLIAA